MEDETVVTEIAPHADTLAVFDRIAKTEGARVEAEEAEKALEVAARREIRDSLFDALDKLLKSRRLHLWWNYTGDPPRLIVEHAEFYCRDGKLGLRVIGETSRHASGS